MNETEKTDKKQLPIFLHKVVTEVFTKLKKHTPNFHISHASRSLSSTTSKLLHGCRHPRSLSFSLSLNRHPYSRRRHSQQLSTRTAPVSGESAAAQVDEAAAATLEDIDRFLVENFKSLFSNNEFHHNENPAAEIDEIDHQHPREVVQEIDHHHQQPVEFDISSTEHAQETCNLDDSIHPQGDLSSSHRSFTPSTNRPSSSIIAKDVQTPSRKDADNAVSASIATMARMRIDPTLSASEITSASDGCIAVLTASPNPHEDFRDSMEKVTEARVRNGERIDWEFLEELLFSYLRLNEKQKHRFVLDAFVDLVVSLRQNADSAAADTSTGGEVKEEEESGN